MKLFKNLQSLKSIKNSVVAIGMFDGLHLGHKSVVDRVIAIALEKKITSIIITFSNSPVSYFAEDIYDLQITESENKINLFKKTQLNYLFIVEFNEYLANLEAYKFVNEILISLLKVNNIVFGYDNHFGKNREGTFEFIKNKFPNITAETICASKKNRITISSTKIKEELLKGNITAANQMLGYSYFIVGKVVKGMQLGRKLGFPTANISFEKLVNIIPKNGVYFTNIKLLGIKYLSITNIGTRPTIHNSNDIYIETHILDFTKTIYGKKIELIFLKRIRDESKFDNISELINQINKDIELVRKLNNLHITA